MGSLASLGIHGGPAALAALVGVAAYMFHHHGWFPRVTSWLFAGSALLLTIAVTAWLDALAGLTATGTGLTVLIAVVVIAGTLAWKHTSDRRKHRPGLSTAIFMVAAVAVLVAVASFRIIMTRGATSLKGSGQALGQAVASVNSGDAAHAMPASHRLGIFVWGVVLFIAVVIVLKMTHGRGRRGSRASGPAAITSGNPPAPVRGLGPVSAKGRR
jgi:glucan phosphoethanolaminetransferase (alkaline phosphatase superfamily)